MEQLIFSFVALFSLILVIRALIDLLAQVSQLRTRQIRIEFELEKLSAELPGKRAQVEELKLVLPPLKRAFQEMYTYYHMVREIEQAAEQEEMEKEQGATASAQKETKPMPQKEIHQRKIGWEDF